MTCREKHRARLAAISLLLLGAGGLASCSQGESGKPEPYEGTHYLVTVVDVEVVRTIDGGAVSVNTPTALADLEVEP